MEKKENTNPWLVLLLLWGVTLFFTLYDASAIQDELKYSWTEKITGALDRTSKAIGVGNIHDGVQALRSRVNDDYVVLASETVESAPPPPIAEMEPEKGAHRVAPRKHRVLIVGASSIQFALGVELEHVLPEKYEGVKTKRFGKLATGLARPDFFDWPKKLEQLVKQFKPDLVIANYGGNCGQDIPVDGGVVKYEDEAAWDPLYASRVKELVEIAKKHGSDFVFIGMPNMRDPKFAKKMTRVNRIQKEAAEEAGAMWISVWEMTSTKDGGYLTTIEFEGDRGLMRAIDGVHYRTLGARYVIEQSMQEIERHFVFAPKDPALARSERHSFESKLHGRELSYVAFIPETANDQHRLPVLYLVPGHVSKWNEWPNYPHRALQRLANRHQLVLVVLEEEELTPELFAKEIVPDVEGHLPVSDRRGLLGPDLLDTHVALERTEFEHTFTEATADAFRRSLAELIGWHAEQLRTPVTRR